MQNTHVSHKLRVKFLLKLLKMPLQSSRQSRSLAKAYSSSQIIQAVEEGKSLEEVMDLASDLTLDKISRVKEKVKKA